MSFPNVSIVAAGRGRSMCLDKIQSTVLSLLPLSVKQQQKPKLVYLGTATYDKDEPFQQQTHAYQESCQVIRLNVSEAPDNNSNACSTIPSDDEIRSTIASAHIVLVSGGNTLYAVNRWKQLKIDQYLRETLRTNEGQYPILCGGSAGAICWFSFGHSDSLDPTTFLNVDPNLSEEDKKNWEYIR